VQSSQEAWDYGDSDSAFVTPVFANAASYVEEWRAWMERPAEAPAIAYWLGPPPAPMPDGRSPAGTVTIKEWSLYPQSGIAVASQGPWRLRWDNSPLGYLRTAAHGHLDVLHLSIWLEGVAMVIDPGTGAYYGDLRLRNWLASRAAHNGPDAGAWHSPRRLGPFLWSKGHESALVTDFGQSTEARVQLGRAWLRRRVAPALDVPGWTVEDECLGEYAVNWQFAPGSQVQQLSEGKFVVRRGHVAMAVDVSGWSSLELQPAGSVTAESLPGVVSPRFREVVRAPRLTLTSHLEEDPDKVQMPLRSIFTLWST